MKHDDHVPPLGFHALTGIYDPVVALTMPEEAFRRRIVERAAPNAGERVLDLGCGTGELSLALKVFAPRVDLVSLDPDERALAIAQAKLAESGVDARFVHGTTGDAGLETGAFDLIVSSLVLHHLDGPAKRSVLEDVVRLLRPGGRVSIGDWGGAGSWMDRARFLPVRLLDGLAQTRDNVEGRVPDLMREAGLVEVEECDRIASMFGPLSVFVGRRPAD
jgi:SAM-dependent methyltransferase